MLKDAKVISSKFLQLRNKLNIAINNHKGYDNSVARAHGTSEITLNINAIQQSFGELCELLHELLIEQDSVVDIDIDKQIEEFAKIIDTSPWKIQQDNTGCHINSKELAEYFISKGYCKTSNTPEV